MRAAIARLTDNEKECLRRRLVPQTAKEMAIELGVSPHAVEKRLKMARTKLGLSSSLQAARLLVQAESQPLVPQPSDLAATAAAPHAGRVPGERRRRWILGGLTMISITIAMALASAWSGAPAPAPTSVAAGQDGAQRVPATPETAKAFLASSFDTMDRDKSGFVDASEAPRMTVRFGPPEGPMVEKQLTREQASAQWIARNDGNRDGKVSKIEFIAANRAMIEATGLPARWKPHS
jgi:DNA-binding CsgD family transcriptional regulator